MSNNKNDVSGLLKIDDGISQLQKSRKYKNTKTQMRSICKTLSKESSQYRPEKMIESIDLYIETRDKLDRILYSEISNYIFGLTSDGRGTFLTNIENLFLYVLENGDKVKDDTRKIVTKIYDHAQLAIHQIENASNIFNNSIVDAKNKLHDEIKGIEKEYITILGIFAAIVLAFVGGITFTTSVLENIDKASVFRLIITVDVIGAVLVNVIYLLITFILKINGKCEENNKKFIKNANLILLGMAILVMAGWILNIKDLQICISQFFKWTR